MEQLHKVNSDRWAVKKKNAACQTGVVRFRSASVALCSSRRGKKGRFVQRRIIPLLARSRTKACVSDSALTYTVFTQSSQRKRAQQRANFGTQAESSVVSHLNKHDYEIIRRGGGSNISFLVSAPCSCPHSFIFRLTHTARTHDIQGDGTSVRHHVM